MIVSPHNTHQHAYLRHSRLPPGFPVNKLLKGELFMINISASLNFFWRGGLFHSFLVSGK